MVITSKKIYVNNYVGFFKNIHGIEVLEYEGHWVTFRLDGLWCQAKVQKTKSKRFGIGGSRITKLCICRAKRFSEKKVVYNYDRGELEKETPSAKEVLPKILEIFT